MKSCCDCGMPIDRAQLWLHTRLGCRPLPDNRVKTGLLLLALAGAIVLGFWTGYTN